MMNEQPSTTLDETLLFTLYELCTLYLFIVHGDSYIMYLCISLSFMVGSQYLLFGSATHTERRTDILPHTHI